MRKRQKVSLEDYTYLCRREANKQWCYADLVSDHPERVEQAWGLGEQPADFIRWLGEKYDLTPADRW